MRVTKTIREFIECEVSTRLMPKYEAERQEAKRQSDIEQEVWEEALTAMQEACDKVLDKAIAEHDFLGDLRDTSKDRYVELRKHCAFHIKDRYNRSSVHHYWQRKADETKKTVNGIILELELGGTKAELMEMLDKVGQ